MPASCQTKVPIEKRCKTIHFGSYMTNRSNVYMRFASIKVNGKTATKIQLQPLERICCRRGPKKGSLSSGCCG
jgi:hypothetical protein